MNARVKESFESFDFGRFGSEQDSGVHLVRQTTKNFETVVYEVRQTEPLGDPTFLVSFQTELHLITRNAGVVSELVVLHPFNCLLLHPHTTFGHNIDMISKTTPKFGQSVERPFHLFSKQELLGKHLVAAFGYYAADIYSKFFNQLTILLWMCVVKALCLTPQSSN
jgi:hypothetical protein